MSRQPRLSPPVLRGVALTPPATAMQPQRVQGVARDYVNPDLEHCQRWCPIRGHSEAECRDRCAHAY